MRLGGRVLLITGGAAGIGKAAALRAAREGAAVSILDVSRTEGEVTVREIVEAGGRARFSPGSVTDPDMVENAVRDTVEAFGALHVLITAAGILQGAYRQVEELDPETFARVMEVNVQGTYLSCRYAVPAIEASGGGVVLCVASGAGVQGPSSSLVYGASKAAVHGFCRTLEHQLRPRGIRVNVVCPGTIDTALKRQNVRDGALARGEDPEQALAVAALGDPDGVASILAFLASPEADYLVGTVFTR